MSQMEAELKLPLVQNWQSRGSAALRQIANCPSNVRWRRVRTDGRLLDTLTEPGSLWSMSSLSSPCRMETVPGFSPWKLVIPHCGTPCLAFNFPINNCSQHLFARARNCRGWCHDAYSDMGRCYQFVATLTLRGNTHTQIIPNPSQSSKHLISHDNCKKHLAFESQWVKWKQSWNFRSLKVAKSNCCIIYAHCQLSQQCALTVARLLDTLTEPSSLWSMSPLSSPCRMQTAPGFSPWKLVIPHCGTPCLVFNFPINNFSQHLVARAGRCRGWCPAAWFKIGWRSKLLAQTKQTPDEVAASSHGWEWRFYVLVKQIDLISDSSCKKTSLQISLKLPLVKNRKVELLHHLRTLPTVLAMSVGDVCRRPADLVIIRFNMINVTEHSSLPSLPTPFAKWLLLSSPCRMGTAPGFSPWKLVTIFQSTTFLNTFLPEQGIAGDDVTMHILTWAGATSS